MSESNETTTITIHKNTKVRLETIKGKKDWDSFLQELYLEKRSGQGRKSLAKLRDLLDEEDLDRIIASSKKFRREFRLA
ncbi:MAG: antitoxin VapB family protein [Nitrososphaerales archaeon]